MPHTWLVLIASLILPAGCSQQPAATSHPSAQARTTAQPPPNILFILVDDQAPGWTGFEGNPVVKTPNLDRMTAEGTRLTRAYVVLPQCAPSRAALLTGLYPHVHGPLSNDAAELAPGVKTIADVLGAAGYRRGLVGKWHLENPLEKQAGFDDYWVAYDKASTPRAEKYTHPTIVVNGKSMRVKRFLTDVFTDYAIEFIDQPDPRPFFLWLSYHAPHTPITPHPDFPYNPTDFALPANMADDLRTKPPAQQRSIAHRSFKSMGPRRLKAERAAYASMISAIDADVGRLLAHLLDKGLAENTLVIFFSDNGWMIGEHQMYSKGAALYEELVRMPMIVWQPGTVPARRSTDALVSSIDLFPTFCARGGAAVPPGRTGHDIWPLITGQRQSIRDAVFFEYRQKNAAEFTPILGLVTERYKYTHYLADDAEELYDLASDPGEMTNLATNAAAATTLAPLRARLRQFQATIKRPFWVK